MHDAMERRRQNDDILRIIVQRLREILDVVRLHDALTSVRLANAFARHLTAVIVQPFQAFTNRAVELAHVLHETQEEYGIPDAAKIGQCFVSAGRCGRIWIYS